MIDNKKLLSIPENFQVHKFNQSIYLEKKLKPKKWVLIVIFAISFLVLMSGLAAINIRYANDGKYNFSDLYYIFSTNNIFDNNTGQIKSVITSHGETFGQFEFIDLRPIRKAIWVSIVTVFAGAGLATVGCIAQGLTKNPLSDSTTLGTTEASLFGFVLTKIVIENIIQKVSGGGYSSNIAGNNQYIFLSFGFLGASFSVLFILFLIKNSKNQLNYVKITLAGLAISIFFRTINFLLRSRSQDAARTSFALVLGGAENAYGLYSSQETIMYIGIGVILFSIFVIIVFARHLTLLELGDLKAKALGINVTSIKVVGLLIIFVLVPTSLSLVGNVAFAGLFAPHVIRMLFRTRNYQIVIPLSAILGAFTLSLGLTLHVFVPSIPSSIFMIFIGAPMLIYLGWFRKGK